jgi:hypothetical protein
MQELLALKRRMGLPDARLVRSSEAPTERACFRRLAELGGTMPELEDIPRRRMGEE